MQSGPASVKSIEYELMAESLVAWMVVK
jgi:hypothetical protein